MKNKSTAPLPSPARTGRVLVITGMSGAGKSRVIQCLEDLGFFCVDNLPPALFGKLFEAMTLTGRPLPDTAIVADIRSGAETLPQLEEDLLALRQAGFHFEIIFMEASDPVLVRRYKENRRPHPLAKSGGVSLLECLDQERRLLTGLRSRADMIIDTSDLAERGLYQMLEKRFGPEPEQPGVAVTIISFGFKFGLPIDADLVIDVRFVPNPFYVPELKELTGLDPEVAKFVLTNDISKEFLSRYLRLLHFLLPHYQQEGKRSLVLAVGCTGGRHRSVAIGERLAQRLRGDGYSVTVSHRDLQRAGGRG